MSRRAVIYIRTSSGTQGEKTSPVEQEAGCRLAEEKGLDVVRMYRDVQKYRVGNRLVEPSGARSDRPGLLAKENFDLTVTPVRTWAARMELDEMKERRGMGVKARLKAGKANTGQDRCCALH